MTIRESNFVITPISDVSQTLFKSFDQLAFKFQINFN